MPFGNWPVASFRQRSVYKTEFDLFKQNTDIDLISLLSYEDHTPGHLDQQTWDGRPKTVPDSKSRPCDFSTSNGINGRDRIRNRTKSALDPSSKINRIRPQPEREFRRNVWNRGDTGVYKAFARTSRTFLKQKHKTSEPRTGLKCKSALDIHKPLVETKTRSQTSCGFHPNERNSTKTGKTSTLDVSNVATTNRETKVNSQVNKPERSKLNQTWRTKSAPTIVNTNKTCYFKRYDSKHDNKFNNINKRCCSGLNENKFDDVHKTKKTCLVDQNLLDKEDRHYSKENQYRSNSPAVTNCSGGNSNSEAEDVTFNGEVIVSAKEKTKEWENIECVENENVTCIVEKEENCDNKYKEIDTSETTVNEDGIGSKDSGFASNAVTPELEFWNKGELSDAKNKCVKFQIETRESEISFEVGEQCSAISENGNSDTLNDSLIETENNAPDSVYDINSLITDLERFGTNSRLSVISVGGQSNFTVDGETESLCGDAAQKALESLREAEEKEKAKFEEEEEKQSTPNDIESLIMSKEARHAIMETLKDMGTKKGKMRNKENDSADIRHKGVNVQRRQHDNRNKYEYYMRERTKSDFRSKFKYVDSLGNEENSSAYSSPRERRECDETSSEENVRGKLFPSIRENTKLSKSTTLTNQSNVMTLEHMKKTKRKIPGIGNYHLIASPDNDFEITPPGFDSRYNLRPVISKEEMEIPPRFIRERSIEKCRTWLTNIDLSPLSLRPAKRTK